MVMMMIMIMMIGAACSRITCATRVLPSRTRCFHEACTQHLAQQPAHARLCNTPFRLACALAPTWTLSTPTATQPPILHSSSAAARLASASPPPPPSPSLFASCSRRLHSQAFGRHVQLCDHLQVFAHKRRERQHREQGRAHVSRPRPAAAAGVSAPSLAACRHHAPKTKK